MAAAAVMTMMVMMRMKTKKEGCFIMSIIMGRRKEGGRGTSLTVTRILVHGFGCKRVGELW